MNQSEESSIQVDFARLQHQIATLAQKLEAAEATAIKREDRIHELKLEMDAERQRAEAAEQDTARLEWYNENALSVTWATGYLGSKSGWSYMAGNGYKQDAQSLREAIDLARKDGA